MSYYSMVNEAIKLFPQCRGSFGVLNTSLKSRNQQGLLMSLASLQIKVDGAEERQRLGICCLKIAIQIYSHDGASEEDVKTVASFFGLPDVITLPVTQVEKRPVLEIRRVPAEMDIPLSDVYIDDDGTIRPKVAAFSSRMLKEKEEVQSEYEEWPPGHRPNMGAAMFEWRKVSLGALIENQMNQQ